MIWECKMATVLLRPVSCTGLWLAALREGLALFSAFLQAEPSQLASLCSRLLRRQPHSPLYRHLSISLLPLGQDLTLFYSGKA